MSSFSCTAIAVVSCIGALISECCRLEHCYSLRLDPGMFNDDSMRAAGEEAESVFCITHAVGALLAVPNWYRTIDDAN